MIRSSLSKGQLWVLQIVESIGFGRIEDLCIRGGVPAYGPATTIIREIKLDRASEEVRRSIADMNLRAEFARLFEELARIGYGEVDLDIRHHLPFRLVVRSSPKELA